MGKLIFWLFRASGKRKRSLSVHSDTLITLPKPSIKVLSLFSDSFRARKIFYYEKRPNGISFKLFLDALNMKILSSAYLLHTRKIIWRVVFSMVGYLFFCSDGLFIKKEHSSQSWVEEFSWVLFYTFSGPRD